MLRFSGLDPALLNPGSDQTVFEATINALGTYTTEHFVLRLSPRTHELVDAITRQETDGYDTAELYQAYSTYLHETIHWWQHVGSTAGLILSLAYPAQVHGSMGFLADFAREVGAVKPVKAWADRALIDGTPTLDLGLVAGNVAVNNALDINYYKQLALIPKSVLEHERSPFFLGVGHSYLKAYGDTVSAINGSCDFADGQFPNPESWDAETRRLHAERSEGFPYGPRPPYAEIGLRQIFESQARICQIQFLASAGGPELLQTYRDDGYFAPLYRDAFELFLKLTATRWPERYDDPLVGLFLLICDLAINPTRGFPLDIEHFDDLISDLDAGARFTLLCLAAAEAPELANGVQTYSALEYDYIAGRLTDRCGYDHPRTALEAVVRLLGDGGPVDALMEEHRTFGYPQDELIALQQAQEAEARAAPIAANIPIEALNFAYRLSGNRPAWRPVRVFDDGRQTFIEFPESVAQGQMPPLFGLGEGNQAELLNYRVSGRFMIVDRLLAHAELRLGDRRSQQRVEIRKERRRTPS